MAATRRQTIGSAITILVACALFAWCLGLRHAGAWYSSDVRHRLQTEALLRGTLALQPTPHGQHHDWAWGHGSQQVWGLGVALLRLPFDAAAKLAGAVGFPDRLVLLGWFALVALVVVRALRVRTTVDESDDMAGRRTTWEQVALVAVVLFCPVFVTLCRTRFLVYEESIAYGCLTALALIGLLLAVVEHERRATFYALCAVAGMAPLVRVTTALYGAITVALALSWLRRRGFGARALVAGVGLYALGIAAWIATNLVRFGAPFEVGQRLNVSYIPHDQYAKVFGYPFSHEPLGRAIAELISSLFLTARWNGHQFYERALHPWQSDTFRFREFYFTGFGVTVAIAVIVAWIAIAIAIAIAIVGQRRPRLRTALADRRIVVCGIWSLAAFLSQAVFYLRMPTMTSRYLVDFAPSVGVALVGLLLLIFRLAETLDNRQRGRDLSLAATALALGWVAVANARAEIAPTHAAAPLADAKTVAAAVAAQRGAPPAPRALPSAYACGDSPTATSGIPFSGAGWATPDDCTVDALTMLYFERPECLALHVAPRSGAPALTADDTAPLRARLGLTPLVRRSDDPVADGRAVVFCRPPEARPNPTGIEILYLGVVAPDQLRVGARPLRLLSIENRSDVLLDDVGRAAVR